jgi:hypothetical protein
MLEGLSLLFLSRVLSSCLDVRIKIRRMVETLPEGDLETEHRTGEVKMELKEERREEEESEELYEDPTELPGRMRTRKYFPCSSFFFHRNTIALQPLLCLVRYNE